MTQILRGNDVTEALNKELLERSEILKSKGVNPVLGIVRLGERPEDLAYERGATKRAEKTGVTVKKFLFSKDMSEEDLIKEIYKINDDDSVHGVLIFMPLPKHIDEKAIRDALSPLKDVDGITDMSQFGVYVGDERRGYPPCTAEACIHILEHYNINPEGKIAAVIGRSCVIGRPVAMMLLKRNATVTICHTKTENLSEICKKSDLVIAAAGHIGIVTEKMMHKDQIIIDVAVNFDNEGNMCGDVDRNVAEDHVRALTPVPGGVGTVTTSILMKHVIEAAEKSLR